MNTPRVIHFYLEPDLKQSAEVGKHNFLNKIANVGRAAGMEIRHSDNSASARAGSDPAEEWAVLHMDPVPHARAVTLRRAYYYPFWSIEQTDRRRDFDVAQARFKVSDVPGKQAARLVDRWRRKWFAGWHARAEGHVYVPLQGKLLQRRSFQSCTPLEMLADVLCYDSERPVIATLHPKESYGEEELAALGAMQAAHPRLNVEVGGIEGLLAGCDYVVTQNSSAGFAGYFFGKPLVLFAEIDFHHIAARVWESGPQAAIRAAPQIRPDFDAYLYWFLQIMAVNAGRPEAEDKIAARLRGFGWPV